jgi:hypothetical protein
MVLLCARQLVEYSEKRDKMDEEKETASTADEASAQDAWQAVGRQFQQLGDSLFSAINATLDDPQTRAELQHVKSSLSEAAEQISSAVKETVDSEDGRRVRDEVGKAADTLRGQGEEMYAEVRPELVSAFRQLRAELDTIISRMEPKQPVRPDVENEQQADEKPE